MSKRKSYCSKWCGLGCTKDMHDLAVKRAKALAKELNEKLGKGWTWEVWENLGWYSKAISPCKRIHVHPNYYSGKLMEHTAYLNEVSRHPGGKWADHGRTAKSSVRNVIKKAKAEIARMQAIVEGL